MINGLQGVIIVSVVYECVGHTRSPWAAWRQLAALRVSGGGAFLHHCAAPVTKITTSLLFVAAQTFMSLGREYILQGNYIHIFSCNSGRKMGFATR